MTTTAKTPVKKRTSRAKPKVAEQPVQEAPAENVAQESELECSDLGGAHPDGEAELERLAIVDKEGVYDDLDRPEYADAGQESEKVGWEAIQSAGLLHMAFAAVAAGRGAHWVLMDKEAEMLGGSLDAVLDKYFPDGPGQYGPEIALFSSAVMICAPRLALDVKQAAANDDAAANDEDVTDELPSQA